MGVVRGGCGEWWVGQRSEVCSEVRGGCAVRSEVGAGYATLTKGLFTQYLRCASDDAESQCKSNAHQCVNTP